MSDNIVYEITKLMNDRTTAQKDMNDAAGLVIDMFKKKYVNKLYERVQEHDKVMMKSPPPEVELLNAMKHFMPNEKHANVDKAIELMKMMKTISIIQNEANAFTLRNGVNSMQTGLQSDESSIHEDGIYDIDKQCMVNRKSNRDMAGLFMIAALSGII